MDNLIKFTLGDGTPLLLDPSFIKEVSGRNASTTITVERKDSDGNYVTYRIPLPVESVVKMIEEH